MKNIRICVTTLLIFLLSVTAAISQYSVSPTFSILKSSNNDKPVLPGGGLQAGYQLTSNLQLGLAYSFYPAKSRDRQLNPTFKASYKDQASNIAVTATYLFLDSNAIFRPFAGLDAGVNFAEQHIAFFDLYTGNREFNKKVNNIIVSPKIGAVLRVANWLSIIPQVQYHLSVQKRKQQVIGYAGSSGTTISLAPIQNFYTADIALSIRF